MLQSSCKSKTAMVSIHWLWNRLQLVKCRFSNILLSVFFKVSPSIALLSKICLLMSLLDWGYPTLGSGSCEGSAMWTNWVIGKRANSTSHGQPNNDKCCILFSQASSFRKAVKQVKIGYTCCWQIGVNIWDAKKKNWSHYAETSEYISEEMKWGWS